VAFKEVDVSTTRQARWLSTSRASARFRRFINGKRSRLDELAGSIVRDLGSIRDRVVFGRDVFELPAGSGGVGSRWLTSVAFQRRHYRCRGARTWRFGFALHQLRQADSAFDTSRWVGCCCAAALVAAKPISPRYPLVELLGGYSAAR